MEEEFTKIINHNYIVMEMMILLHGETRKANLKQNIIKRKSAQYDALKE
jgi:hypothetical protein